MYKLSIFALASGLVLVSSAITVEVAPGESEAVKIAAENLRRDIAKVCPGHAKDTRRIVVKTSGKGDWESSVRTYRDGVWTIEGADRRGIRRIGIGSDRGGIVHPARREQRQR